MPCRYDDDDTQRSSIYLERESLRKELDKATRLLCEIMSDENEEFYPSTELLEWYEEHKKKDEARKQAEKEARKAKKEAAKRITEELEVLERRELERLKGKYEN